MTDHIRMRAMKEAQEQMSVQTVSSPRGNALGDEFNSYEAPDNNTEKHNSPSQEPAVENEQTKIETTTLDTAREASVHPDTNPLDGLLEHRLNDKEKKLSQGVNAIGVAQGAPDASKNVANWGRKPLNRKLPRNTNLSFRINAGMAEDIKGMAKAMNGSLSTLCIYALDYIMKHPELQKEDLKIYEKGTSS